MLNDMIEEQNNTMVLKEPERIADWDDAILESPALLSGKTYTIRLLHVLSHSERPLTEERIEVIKSQIRDYPELTDEVKELFPTIFE